ncbi:DUF6525 family protein [Phaeobacter sp. C3_T13_0]|uniref:DUF6525 family protein n=1 Tax=Phaeobacter cretensis TaxID=3342641 RepID=UPI0039BD770C
MSGNLGSTSLRKRRRTTNPMRTYDTLPQPLRLWLANAALPWSPKSCKRLWDKARKAGLSAEDAIRSLTATEKRMLARDKFHLS